MNRCQPLALGIAIGVLWALLERVDANFDMRDSSLDQIMGEITSLCYAENGPGKPLSSQ